MASMTPWMLFPSYLSPIILVIGGILLLYNQNKTAQYQAKRDASSLDTDTIEKLKDAIQARDLQIAGLQQQITQLKAQMAALELSNQNLKDLAIGKEILTEIKGSLGKFDILLGDGGLLHQFAQSDKLLLDGLHDIKGLLNDKRKD